MGLWSLALKSYGSLRLIDFTLSNATRFYSSMWNPTGVKGLKPCGRQDEKEYRDNMSNLS